MVLKIKSLDPLIEHQFTTTKKYMKRMFTFNYMPNYVVRLQNEALRRGVKIKLLATEIDKEKLKLMKDCIKRGIQVKYYPVKEIRLVIIDGKGSLIGIINPWDQKERIGIFVESEELTKGLEYYFDSLWRKAKSITEITL